MKKQFLITLFLSSLLFSCTKNDKTDVDPLVGTWRTDKIEAIFFMTNGGEVITQEELSQNNQNYTEFIFSKNEEVRVRTIENGREIENTKGSYTKTRSTITMREQDAGGSSFNFNYVMNGSALQLSTSDFYFEGLHMDDVLTILEHAVGVGRGELSFEIIFSMRKI